MTHQLLSPVITAAVLVFLLNDLFRLQEIFFIEKGAVHLSSPLHQIMGLIDEKNVRTFSAAPLPEKALQIDIQIKDVIIVTDNHIHPQGKVKAQFKGTDLILLRLCKNHFSGT